MIISVPALAKAYMFAIMPALAAEIDDLLFKIPKSRFFFISFGLEEVNCIQALQQAITEKLIKVINSDEIR